MDKYIGKRLDGRYEIHELIGVGGMANVYRCKQEDGITVSVTVSLGAQMRELPAIQGNKIDEAAQSLADRCV